MQDLDYIKGMRLKFNLYASRTACQRFEKAIKNNDDHEVYAATGELLLWIMNIDHWFIQNKIPNYKKNKNNNTSGQTIKGLAYAYNCIKHNMDIFTIHNKEGGLSFPIQFPIQIPSITVRWIAAPILTDPKFEKQRSNYIRYIQGKELLPTFKNALTFLNEESQKLLFKNKTT